MSEAKKLLAIMASAAILGGCDGGITGTGGPMTDLGDIIVEADSGPMGGTNDPAGDVAVAALNSDIEFVNNADASLRSDAIAKIVHTVTGLPAVYAVLNQDFSAPLIPQPGINFGDGAQFYLSLPADTLELDVLALGDETSPTPAQIAGINPLILSAGSASTFVLRGLPSSTETDDPYTIEMLAVANILSTNQSSTINFRVLHAAPLFDAEQGDIDIYVRTADSSNPTTGLPTFEEFDYSIGDSDYFETTAASYSITVTNANGQTQLVPTTDAITPSPGSSTTIIVVDDPNGVAGVDVEFIIMNDGDRSGLPEE